MVVVQVLKWVKINGLRGVSENEEYLRMHGPVPLNANVAIKESDKFRASLVSGIKIRNGIDYCLVTFLW